MKLRRRVPLFYPTGEFRCRVNREDVPELLANREADPRCDRCGSPTAESSCFDGKDHDLILILRRASFNREGAPVVIYACGDGGLRRSPWLYSESRGTN